jgi:hypothetical protein
LSAGKSPGLWADGDGMLPLGRWDSTFGDGTAEARRCMNDRYPARRGEGGRRARSVTAGMGSALRDGFP